ncbi:MAG: bifunctional riboflavin kinase/FAD synthetase [Rhodanobacteraceae bacterium]|nr:bifunctional riboflavin kinase/FAD synthetase [Rhodanobacteraceae bacterium]MBK7044081.1 bifunctional riboflavin kinase/FAD synthetase [Rhodanobacteraceae bacterium]MBP9154916.1 bifunctional riboflavin kinase/FAD synthetase [Xanthomonadales bacterium]HQW81731.1 bifunctional riboflavin kinase/FAD synthetase [Pseudomonadota bacterium]
MNFLFRDTRGPRLCPRGAVIAIGAFDGLHRGHQTLIGRVLARAHERACDAVVLSFEPLPREYFGRGERLPRLSTAREKIEMTRALGVDRLGLLRFNAALTATSAEDFVEQILVHRLGACEVWIGPDFRFGHNRRGDVAMLRDIGAELGFTAHTIEPVLIDGERISSTRVRAALLTGDHALAQRLLGRDFAIGGRVIHGQKLGRTLGYPTANISLGRRRPPVHGIYAVRVSGAGLRDWPSVASLGTRPTVDGRELLLEAHLFDFDGDLYGQRLRVDFIAKIRDEARFANLDDLIERMHLDSIEARRILSNLPSNQRELA